MAAALFFGGPAFGGCRRRGGYVGFIGIAGPGFSVCTPEQLATAGFLISFSHVY